MVNATMRFILDDDAIESIVSMLMRIQDQENTTLPLLEKRLKQTETGINNLLNAVQNGLFTPSTKERLESLEAEKAELEIQIEKERLVKPKISAEFMTFWLHRFRKLDVTQKSHRQMLIDTFVNAIYVYDDKLLLTYNFKEGTDTISLADVKNAAKGKNGSDLKSLAAPNSSVENVHDRMPLILRRDQVRPWLTDAVAALELLAGRPPLLRKECCESQLGFADLT